MRSWRCIEFLVLLLCLAPLDALGQCAACSNPNFGGGASDLGLAKPGRPLASELRLRTGLTYALVDAPRVFVGTAEVANSERRTSTAQSLVLSTDAQHRRGTGVGVLLPFATVRGSVNARTQRDTGLGDVEWRLRQDLAPLLDLPRWRLALAAGTVAPTGTYTRSSTDAVRQSNQYASLGRGTWWLLADGEAAGRLGKQFMLLAGVQTRWPLGDAPDGFRWGREVRARAGGAIDVLDERLQLTLTGEWLERAQGSEVFGSDRVPAISTGGAWWSVVPAVRVQVARALAASAGARVPVYRDVKGLQNVDDVNVFATLAWDLDFGAGQ